MFIGQRNRNAGPFAGSLLISWIGFSKARPNHSLHIWWKNDGHRRNTWTKFPE
jgi:hypothetical protein